MKLACVLVTHLPMKIELRRYPELRGKPAIIVETHGSQQLVLDYSPEARGVGAGMSLPEAEARCKDATLLEADQPRYQQAFDEIIASLLQRSPLVERAEPGCAYVGLDGLAAMYGGEGGLATALLQAVPQVYNPRVGVAHGKFLAYLAAVASRGGRAQRVTEDVAAFLKDFTVDLLPLSRGDKVRLHQFGLHTLGQVASLPLGPLQAQLGLPGKRAWDLANGIDHSPLLPAQPQETVTESLTFASPTVSQQALLVAAETLLGKAFSRPLVRGKYVRSVLLEGNILRHPPWVRGVAFREPVGSRERALSAIKSGLASVALPGPLEDLTLSLGGLTGESGIQTGLFSDSRKWEQLGETLRQLEVQLGQKPPIFRVRDLEPWSRIPERRQILVRLSP